MKKYVIDDLQPADLPKLKDYLNNRLKPSGLAGIFWLFLEDDLLSDVQKEHTECHPYYLAIELTQTALHCELLVRTTQRLRCDCIAYTDRRQREWAIDQLEAFVKTLSILA